MRIKDILFSIGLLLLFYACGGTKQPFRNIVDGVPAPEDVVMYQVNPRVFAPAASFKVIGEYLDSIRRLGVNVVWFMPINEVGKEKSVNSPYCVKDYKSVNPEFGTMEDFRHLIGQCHDKGMSVIIDWVANHTSWDNAWMEHKDWYTQDDEGKVVSPANTGWKDVADLNFDNQEKRLAMIDAMKFWVDSVGIDGFRCDAADFVPYDFWKQALDSLRAIPGHSLLMLAEGKRKDHFTAGFDMNYAWDFLEGTRDVFRKDTCASTLFDIDRAEYDSLSAGKIKLRFTTNHDEMAKRSPIKEFGNERGAMAAFVLSTYLHGGALIYGSQEVGYPERIDFFHYCPVDWKAEPALREEFKTLVRLYNEYPAIRKGNLKTYPDCNVLVFEKELDEECFLVLVNVRNSNQTVSLPEAYKGSSARNIYTNESVELTDTLTLVPYEYKILEINH